MGDAEDVLIHAAEHVGAATRALWLRRATAEGGLEHRVARAERRIAAWLAAQGGEPLPVTAWDAPAPPGWLARLLGRPAPWRTRPRVVAWTDGAQLFLPRAWLAGDGADGATRLLLAALAQGRRVAAARVLGEAGTAIERDVRFALEAALGDAELAAAFPGLGTALDAARDEACAARPALERLRPAERAVEELVRALLTGPARSAARALAVHGAADSRRDGLVATARAWGERLASLAGGYRGVAPVEHWGAPGPAQAGAHAAGMPSPPSPPPGRRARMRSLERPVLRRPADAEDDADSRRGPFVVPHGDPQLAVQDARGLARPEDRGDEDLDALTEELERADALPTVRSEGDVREILAAGRRSARGEAGAPAAATSAAAAFLYPEWDVGRAAYRDPGIVLRESLLPAADAAWAARARRERAVLLTRLRRQFEALRSRRERIGRQFDGDTLDVDGIAAEHAERRAGLAPEGRLYGRERPRRRDVAVALLVDASGSTDGWVSRGERVIDVAKQAALCLGEALAALGDRHAVYAFSGRGPGDVRVGVAKRFSEPWSEAARARVGALQPDRSTRLGGPIRHATARLSRENARARLLLVLSDGKPDDDDAYEGAYGLEDVRQAVFEARRAGVRPFCVTIDRAGPSYLPRLFGPHGYTVLWDVQQLPERLPAIYRRLVGA